MTVYIYKALMTASEVAEKVGVTDRLTDVPSLEFSKDSYNIPHVSVSLPGVTLSNAEKDILQDIASTMKWGYLVE